MARRSSMARYRLGDLLERQVQVEDLAGVDLAVPDEVDQLGQEAAHRRGTAVQVDVREEDLLAWELNAVSDTDVADVPAWPGGADGLHLDSWVPTASITECAPSPLVSSLILATPSSPRSSTMYDAARRVTVLFGGTAGHFEAFDDTWVLGGRAWQQVG